MYGPCMSRTRPRCRVALPALIALAPLGCDGGGDQGGLCGDPCELRDENNFDFSSELWAEMVALQEFQDITIEWPDVSVDLQGHDYAAGDVDEVMLVVFAELTPDEVAARLAEDTVQQADVQVTVFCEEPHDSSCQLDEFCVLGSCPNLSKYFQAGTQGAWLFVLNSEDVAGARALIFVDPSAGSTDTTVTVTDDSYSLEVDVDLRSLATVPIGTDADVEVDWGELTTDGYGNAMSPHTLDLLEVGRYELTVEEMEQQFLDLELIAAERWELDVSEEESARLSDLEGDTPFTGVTADSTWMLALRCTSCDNPTPRFLTLLTAE